MPLATKAQALAISLAYLSLAPLPAKAQTSNDKSLTTIKQPDKLTSEEICNRLFQRYVAPLKDLWSKKGIELKAENTDGYALVQDLTAEHCKDSMSRDDLSGTLSRILNHHSGKIAVILPTGRLSSARFITAAFEAHARSMDLDPKKIFVIYDTSGGDEKATQAIASAIFEHKVSVVIGGLDQKVAEVLRQWGSRLLLPTFILGEPTASQQNPFVFYSQPTQRSLAKAAVDANLRYGHKKISILSPSDQRSDRFLAAYGQAAKDAGITILHQVSYDPRRFDLMESAAKKIFRLDAAERKDELKKLYETAKQQAKDTGTRFNPKMVFLQPDIQQDAILIPDTFRIVRHFAKLFVFLGVRKMPLFGHFEWRSVGLISPWDPFMASSYFVDFQGLYSSLPEGIRVANADSPFFLSNDRIEQADFSILGWRAVSVPLQLSIRKNEARRKLDRFVPRKPGSPAEVAYDQDNSIIWAPHLFRLSAAGKSGTISLVTP